MSKNVSQLTLRKECRHIKKHKQRDFLLCKLFSFVFVFVFVFLTKGYVLSIKVNVFLFSHCSVLLFAPNLNDFIFGQFQTSQNWEAKCHAKPWLSDHMEMMLINILSILSFQQQRKQRIITSPFWLQDLTPQASKLVTSS